MASFDIFLNGKRVCTMAGGETGWLKAEMEWFRGPIKEGGVIEMTSLGMRGTDANGDPCDWPRTDLKAGDEITVRIIGGDAGQRAGIISPPPTSGVMRNINSN